MIGPVDLHARDLGAGGQDPLVVLHGLLGSSRNWTAAGRDLAERFTPIGLDLRNHGDSPHTATSSIPEMVGDVLRFMDRQGLDRVHLMGHSLGGKVAMRLACLFPERVRLLFVLDIAPRAYPPGSEALEAMRSVDLGRLESRRDADHALAERIADPGMRAFLLTNLVQDADGSYRWRAGLDGLHASLASLRGAALDAGHSFRRPCGFIVGGRSEYFVAGDKEAVAKHFPLAEITTLESSGHNVHFDARPEFVRAVFDFHDRNANA